MKGFFFDLYELVQIFVAWIKNVVHYFDIDLLASNYCSNLIGLCLQGS